MFHVVYRKKTGKRSGEGGEGKEEGRKFLGTFSVHTPLHAHKMEPSSYYCLFMSLDCHYSAVATPINTVATHH